MFGLLTGKAFEGIINTIILQKAMTRKSTCKPCAKRAVVVAESGRAFKMRGRTPESSYCEHTCRVLLAIGAGQRYRQERRAAGRLSTWVVPRVICDFVPF